MWAPNVKPTPLRRLQLIQNAGLRLATGTLKMSSSDYLHSEAQMLKVDEHIQLLAAQYLASALPESHPAFDTVTRPSGPRNLRETLYSAFYNNVAPYF